MMSTKWKEPSRQRETLAGTRGLSSSDTSASRQRRLKTGLRNQCRSGGCEAGLIIMTENLPAAVHPAQSERLPGALRKKINTELQPESQCRQIGRADGSQVGLRCQRRPEGAGGIRAARNRQAKSDDDTCLVLRRTCKHRKSGAQNASLLSERGADRTDAKLFLARLGEICTACYLVAGCRPASSSASATPFVALSRSFVVGKLMRSLKADGN